MKNLKKVISSLVALTLSASSFAALSASAATVFPDVDSESTYATAISNLYALGIVSGDDTGNFNPDATITRAEVTKMIVESFSKGDQSAQTTTSFTDVDASHWASGYIAYGVSQGYINGMGDGTFAPSAEITYAQAVKLIVGALGYTADAETLGGWPSGYLSYGADLDITKGFSLSTDAAVTRAQVAQLIDNALDVPLSEYAGTEATVLGTTYATYEKKDGTGQYYTSALIKYHDAYVIEGRVTGTAADGTVKKDEVQFQVEYSRRWDQDGSEVNSYFASGSAYGPYTIKVGDTDAADYPYTYAVAYVYENDDDDWEFLAFNPSSKNIEVIFAAANFDDENKNYTYDTVGESIMNMSTKKIYVTNPKTNYTLADDFQLVVNNVTINNLSASTLQKYLVDEAVGDITLIDTAATSGSSTDGKYDYVKVNYYENAVVSGVQQTSDGYRILLTDYATGSNYGLTSSMTLYDDNDDYTYYVRLADENGNLTDITPLDLLEDDVVSIAYNIEDGFTNSAYYEIIASRNTVEGSVSSYSSDDNAYTMNSVAYDVDAYANTEYTANTDIIAGNDYEFKLDAFGRIHSAEETSTSKTYGIVDRVYIDSSSLEKRIRIVSETGSVITLEAKNTTIYDTAYDICYDSNDEKYPVEERIVQYKTASSGSQLNTIEQASGVKVVTDEYKASTNKIGSIRLSDSAVVIDASEAYDVIGGSVYDADGYSTSDFKAASMSTLVDGSEYTVIAANRSTSDYNYRYVVIADNNDSFNMENSVLAVVKGVGSGDLDGTQYDTIEVYQGSEDYVTLYYDGDADYSKGDIITYTMGSDGYIEDGDVVLLYSAPSSSKSYDLASILATAYSMVDGVSIDTLGTKVDNGEEGFFFQSGITKWDTSESGDTAGYARVALAPIVSKSSGSVTLGKLTVEDGNYVTTDDDQLTYGYASDVRITVINYANSGSNMIYNGQSGDIVATSYKVAQDKESGTINWSDSNLADYTNMALVKMFEGDITDIVILVAPEMG